MTVLNQMSVLDMIKAFRRNWRAHCSSERTTLCGPDSMLLALQLSMAENNKQRHGEFTVCLSDVLLTWKYFLHEKLNLPVENMKVIDHYEDIRKTYDDFLKNSNTLDLIDVYKKCSSLTSNCEKNMISSDVAIHATEVSTTAVSRKRKPISRASKRPRGQLRPSQDLSAPGEETCVLASLVQRPPQKQESLAAMSQISSFPKVLHKTRRGKRDPKKLAAAMERVRQWESRLLQNLEEATHHHLTVEIENKKPVIQLNTEDQPDAASEIQLRDFLSGTECAVNDENNPHIPASPVKCSQNDKQVRLLAKKIFLSYLSLLVNSKNDLALAYILNTPDRGLGREAFTDLKHAARGKQLSMFLMATSFIRTLELGGKGYAPPPSDPLWAHAKGLSAFVNFIDKLDEILGEVPNPSLAGGRILSVIRMQLIKGHSSGEPFYKAVEEVVQDLNLRIKNIINSQEGVAVSTTNISPVPPKSFAINHDTAYCGRDAVKILLVLLDEDAASAPTRNKAELLYSDQSTVPHSGVSVLTLFRSPTQVKNTPVKPLRERIHKSLQAEKNKMRQTLIRSQFACTYKDDYIMSKNKWNVNSSSKPLSALHLENDISEGAQPSSVGEARIGTSSETVHVDRSKDGKGPRKSTKRRLAKSKQLDFPRENIPCHPGNELYQPRNVKVLKVPSDPHRKAGGRAAPGAKGSRCTAKDKLIPGQTKLTQFFML